MTLELFYSPQVRADLEEIFWLIAADIRFNTDVSIRRRLKSCDESLGAAVALEPMMVLG